MKTLWLIRTYLDHGEAMHAREVEHELLTLAGLQHRYTVSLQPRQDVDGYGLWLRKYVGGDQQHGSTTGLH